MLQAEKILAEIPRVRLFEEPAPLQRMYRLEQEISGTRIYIKRDDCIPLGMGGNKIRSLEFWLGQARASNSDILVVAGADVSNQCRLTAAAAAKTGLDCLILHSSKEPQEINGNLLLNYLFGAEIRFIGLVNENERREVALETVEKLRVGGRTPYLIGNSVIGSLGYIDGAFELYKQCCDKNCGIRHVFLPGSMGTTEAGFIAANALLGYPFNIHLISVEYGKQELGERISSIFSKTLEYLNLQIDNEWFHCVHIYEEYLGDGYNLPTKESISAISLAASREGIILENTYTSKTFAGMLDLLEKKTTLRADPVCFIHTGGTPALFTQQEFLKTLLI